MTLRTPKYRCHKPSGQAVVTLDGRDQYLGPFNHPDSRAEYHRLVGEWERNGRRVPARCAAESDLSVNELLVQYLRFADGYYRRPDGTPTSEAGVIRIDVRVLRRLYGHTLARDFRPLGLDNVREELIRAGRCRTAINAAVGRIKRLFKWAVSKELVPVEVYQALATIPGLRRGRSDAREPEPVRSIPDAWVDAIQAHVRPPIWAMIQIQRLTGMRPGEAVSMRTGELDLSGAIWTYKPASHKTSHHGHDKTIFIGPLAQEVLRPWLKADREAFLFSPRDDAENRLAERRAARQAPMTPSQRARKRKRLPKKLPGASYTVLSYGHAIAKACKAANVPHWHPHQLRHNAATRLRREFGIEASRVILGHRSVAVSEIYAEPDLAKAADIMARVG